MTTESKRQRQVARQIHKDLGDLFQRELRELFHGAFVTITDVKVSPDLGIARVYLSFMLTQNPNELLGQIREHTSMIRGKFGQMARHQLRIIPEFQFYIDDTAEYAQKIEQLFANLHIPAASEETDEDESK